MFDSANLSLLVSNEINLEHIVNVLQVDNVTLNNPVWHEKSLVCASKKTFSLSHHKISNVACYQLDTRNIFFEV